MLLDEDTSKNLFSDFWSLWDSPFGTQDIEEKEDYLRKADRLGDLAKEIFRKRKCKWLTATEEVLFSFDSAGVKTYHELLSRLSRVFVRPLLRNISRETGFSALTDLLISEVNSTPYVQLNLHMDAAAFDRAEFNLYDRLVRKVVPQGTIIEGNAVFMEVTEPDISPIYAVGVKDAAHTKKDVLYRNGAQIVDVADFISSQIVWRYVRDVVEYYFSYKCGGSYQPTGADLAVFSVIEKQKQSLLKELRSEFCYYNYTPGEPFSLHEMAEECTVFIGRCAFPLKEWLETLSIHVIDEHVSVSEKKRWEDEGKAFAIFDNDYALPSLLLYLLIEHRLNIPYNAFLKHSGRLCFLMPSGWRSRGTKVYDSPFMQFVKEVFLAIARGKKEVSKEMAYFREMEREHARSFETKKNIPSITLSGMENSAFNKYFGFVEFDEAVDLKKAAEVSDEFTAFKEQYIPDINLSEHQLRFRKLGNHKASGLYYPMLKCLCVDIRSPHSFIHELGHLLDYQGGGLSDSALFYPVKSSFIEKIDERMRGNDTFRKMMKAGTKYSYDYYTTATEVFARAFELYIGVCEGLSMSIAPVPEELSDGVYPRDADLLALIKQYFDTLLGREEEKEKAAV